MSIIRLYVRIRRRLQRAIREAEHAEMNPGPLSDKERLRLMRDWTRQL